MISRQRKYQNNCKKLGLCPTCGRPKGSTLLCSDHQKKHNQNSKKKYKRKV